MPIVPQPKKRLTIYLSILIVLLTGKFGYDAYQHQRLIANLPEPAEKTISYAQDIYPILEDRCYRCHGRNNRRGGLSFRDRESLLAGSDFGKVIKVGNSKRSELIHLIGAPKDRPGMPPTGDRLQRTEVAALMAWIDQGLIWEEIESESGGK